MSDNKIMPWIDELEGAAATDFPARRDEIAAMMAEAAELVCKAEELRGKAYFAGFDVWITDPAWIFLRHHYSHSLGHGGRCSGL